jgi:hypothetical protein
MHDLDKKYRNDGLSKDEKKQLKLYVKCFHQLSQNPKHPGLHTHEIEVLSKKYGIKVWQSYLQNGTPSAGRVFWVYGPARGDITICAIESHPDPRKYGQVKLSTDLPI